MKQRKTVEDYLKTIYLLSKKREVHGAYIAEALGVSKPTVSIALKSLEKGGYICRTPRMGDARRNQVGLTEKGRRAAEGCQEVFVAVSQRMLAGFTQEEREQLLSFRRRMLQNLRGCDGAQAPAKEEL